jgi:hypothetical protein
MGITGKNGNDGEWTPRSQTWKLQLASVFRNALVACFAVTATLAAAQEQAPAKDGVPYDPSKNVLDLVNAAVKRQDDLREQARSYQKIIDEIRAERDKERADHAKEIRLADSGLYAAIRTVDREDVAKTAASAQTAISTLAKQTTDLASTLQKTLGDTAIAVEQRQSAFASEMSKRISALELQASERQGNQAVAAPIQLEMKETLNRLAAAQQANVGKSEGISNVWTVGVAAAALLMTMVVFWRSNKNGKGIREIRAT